MKIITASKFYYHRAGLESYLFKITKTLREKGHEIIPFSTTYRENYKTEYDRFFAEYIELGGGSNPHVYTKLRALVKIFYNFEARTKFSALLDYTKPDLIWGFGIHRHLSPSIFMEGKKRHIPVIHRLSDYAIICPDSRLTRGDDKNCKELLCPLKGYHNAIIHRCVRQSGIQNSHKNPSLAASVVGALELYFHNRLKCYINNVDIFIAPSNFLKNTMIKSGIPENKLVHIPIYISPKDFEPNYDSLPYMVYFGRLSYEKGLKSLLNATAALKRHRLVIIGDGPQRKELEEFKKANNLESVSFAGKLYGERLHNAVKHSQLVIVPSTWYDNSPNVILESFALGKPVLGANIGGIPEYINKNQDGLLYEYDNQEELTDKINLLMENPALCTEMGRQGRIKIELKYNSEIHYQKLTELFRRLNSGTKSFINIDSGHKPEWNT